MPKMFSLPSLPRVALIVRGDCQAVLFLGVKVRVTVWALRT